MLTLFAQCFLLHSVIICVCSSENADGSRRQAHKEVMITVAEMKKRIPSEKRSRSKASTVEALHYALNCVKQVQGNQTTRYSCMQCALSLMAAYVTLSGFSAAFVFMQSSAANSEYYNLLMQNGQDERRDASVFTLEELERVTSEHTLKNTVSTHAEKRSSHQLHIHTCRGP